MQVTIKRKFGSPQIDINITNTELSITCELDDFISSMIENIESVTWVFTKAEFEKRMTSAKESVIENMKKETIKHYQYIPVG